MYVIYIIKLIILACNIATVHSVDNTKLSNKRYCANKECSAPISEGKTKLSFNSPTQGILSFKTQQKITIYSKEAGENKNLWGAELNGKRGYVPKNLVKEEKMFFKEVPSFLENIEEELNIKETPEIKPDSVKQPYEVIDGTTVYTGNSEKTISVAESISNTSINPQIAVATIESEEVISKPNSEQSLLDSINKTVTFDTQHPVNDVQVKSGQTENNKEHEESKDSSSLEEGKSEGLNSKEEPIRSVHKYTENSVKIINDMNDGKVPEISGTDHINETDNQLVDKKIAEIEINASAISDSILKTDEVQDIAESQENAFLKVKNSVNESLDLPDLLTTKSEITVNIDVEDVHKVTSKGTSIEIKSKTESNITEDVKPDDINNKKSETGETFIGSPQISDSSMENNSVDQEQYNPDNADYGLNLTNFSEIDLEEIYDTFSVEGDTNEIVNVGNEKTDEATENDDVTAVVFDASDDLPLGNIPETVNEEITADISSEGFLGKIFSNLFTGGLLIGDESSLSYTVDKDKIPHSNFIYNEAKSSLLVENGKDYLLSRNDPADSCSASSDLHTCDFYKGSSKQRSEQNFPSVEEISNSLNTLDFANFFDIILVLSITGGTTCIFFIAYLLIDKCRREGPLIAKINQLEKALLVSRKENVLLVEKSMEQIVNTNLNVDQRDANEEIATLQVELEKSVEEQANLQEQILSLEKELENSTEVGLELNKMISDMLSSQNGSDLLTQHVEQLQKQLVEQHNDIAKYKEKLNDKTTENHELQLELDINKKKVNDLRTEIDKMLLNVLKVEEERDENREKFENTLSQVNEKLQQDELKFNVEIQRLNNELQKSKKQSTELNRNFEIKLKELDLLKDSIKEVKSMKSNSDTLKSLLDMSSVKAELHQLKTDNVTLNNSLQNEQQKTYTFEKQAEIAIQEAKLLKVRFDEADKDRMETQMKLKVLDNYFKEKEGQLQKELSKHEAMWNEKQGEASSTVERIKFMQEELQNYKSQNETLKHEIMSQEVDLKSQISVLEKKSHEYWLNARQVDRKLEDAKQEAAQLRNRLTLQERSYMDDKTNGTMDYPLSPLHHMGAVDHHNDTGLNVAGDSTTSPPPTMLYGGVHRDHTTTSPHNLHSLPPFMPPPIFMPPPPMNRPPPPMFLHHGMPPPPLTQGERGMFGPPGDHRPPPLGRISSPPIPDRMRNRTSDCYSPSTGRTYSPYDDRHTPPSPSYDDDDDDDLDDDDMYNNEGRGRRYYENSYRSRQLDSPTDRQLHRGTKNGVKGSTMSSGGSANSNTSAEKGNSNTSAVQYHNSSV